ncbi:hypothetical protein F4780DRAFT_87394 [Xylariomycetidae sp. FL0641]|nr:hypothetical protein F4780DRAFT_87394 [Xylariomycetidae sp. FL0641]
MSYTWKNIQTTGNDIYGLTENKCHPSVLTNHVGFALMTDDSWYQGAIIVAYNHDPGSKIHHVHTPRFRARRDEEEPALIRFIGGVMTADEGNSTPLATDEEIEQQLGYTRCQTPDCRAELDILRQYQAEAGMATLVQTERALPMTTTTMTTSLSPATSSNQGQPSWTTQVSQPTATGKP